NISGNDIAWDLIRCALSTNALYAIVPIQDIMNLGSLDRMNCPGLAQGWWKFRYTANMLTDNHAAGLAYLVELFNRE
ncbi:MAG: 4-alpha-glucanotransferase, partial [Defluviitaleaceae bacterium]|nr:4-alpha-glucanotransferase [Defluviitaleaceae bacterium]